MPLRAALILSANGRNWSSTINNPSLPDETPMFPPAPSSIHTEPAIFDGLISTLDKTLPCAAAGTALRASEASKQVVTLFMVILLGSKRLDGVLSWAGF